MSLKYKPRVASKKLVIKTLANRYGDGSTFEAKFDGSGLEEDRAIFLSFKSSDTDHFDHLGDGEEHHCHFAFDADEAMALLAFLSTWAHRCGSGGEPQPGVRKWLRRRKD